ncbi:hypothetical protein CPB84DRAFT_1823080 [Gymnopilus junonius]|uniref:THAP9-like helix-turn-helix domain-containing protein n=1 Tax=Gymnopilus junonius TaxID=109634 RepID=A0A9P5NUI6_GYMJU|nr:hypothetical protein CPB84DRAFT_1823080 [Gymnopilus junonius]
MVHHFKCGKEFKMKEPYNTGNFKVHISKCKGTPKSHKLPAGGMQPISSFFSKKTANGAKSASASKACIPLPCPGLCETVYPEVELYLDRSGARGGGGPSISSLACELFGKKFRNLSPTRKRQVRTAQSHEWLWHNDHINGVVYSTSCTKEGQSSGGSGNNSEKMVLPCTSCKSLLAKKLFKNTGLPVWALQWTARNNGGVASGQYKGDDMFGYLLQAVVVKRDKEIRGVGMQNFKHKPDLVEFAHIIHTHSARAYNSLREFLPLPNPRTLHYLQFIYRARLHRSRQPRFPTGIQNRTFSLVIDRLNQLQYDGPVALSCDDTKLLASLRPYYDHDREGFFLMGQVGEPMQLVDHEAFRTVVEENEFQKATKLRLWCIQVPLPKIPTIIVAAMPIPDNLTASNLMEYLWDIVSGFLQRNIKISSYAADGSNVERATQRLLEQRATSTLTIAIKHPHDGPGVSDFTIRIPVFGSQPIATIQDPKHLLKTFRNNLFSGARVLTFPNGIATFSQVREISAAADSPIYVRDVEKADRQDDNAATRLFSGATLEWLSENHPEHLALSFITAHFTVLIVYRDHSGGPHPLLPWLLSTEVVEHVFGLCRQIVKDFTMLDFHEMVPKLFNQLRQAALSSKFSDGKARASGYNHTYTDARGIDILALSTYPSNDDINDAAIRAYGEAESLFALLGVTAADLYFQSSAPVQLPGIRTWLHEEVDTLFGGNADMDEDSDSITSDLMDDYQLALDILEDVDDDLSPHEERQLMGYRYASIALSIEERQHISALPVLDDDSMEEALAEDSEQISHVLSLCVSEVATSLPPVNVDEPENPFGSIDPSNIDLSSLVQLRFAHQTKQAASGVRTSKASRSDESSALPRKELTDRQKILHGFAEIIRARGEKGIGTGLDRAWHWRNPAPGGRNSEIDGASAPDLAAGNAANAAATADSNAKKALKHRIEVFKKHGLPDVLGEARVTSLTPLRVAGKTRLGYGIAISPTLNQFVVCKVESIYSKTGGKNGKHADVTDSSNIMAVSYIAAQVFEHQIGSQFRAIPHAQPISTFRFDHLPPSAFLCALKDAPEITQNGLKISVDDWRLFKELKDNGKKVLEALKAFKQKAPAEGDDE